MSRTLKPEDRISHYRIVGPLGAGGMGEVYRAQDQTLERDVALKILPPELVQSEERVRRFVLEAKSASSLNHPHIVTIYEIGQDRVRSGDGASEPDSAPLHFISMELVSGKTLASKIHQEKTDLKTLLGWLAQAAEGLSKAHAAGIVHRDLKPGNIMVTQDGYAKVLDFGLAKLTERQVAGPDLTTASTVAAEHTSEGAVLGTVGYMAPEQVQGKPVDQRSDIFSFGAILYEAATRRRPFAAESNVETMHQILHQVPAPIEELNPEAPTELRRLIRRCLAKDPNQRLQSMKDLAIELREIVEEYDALSASASSGSGAMTAAPVPAKRRSNVVVIVAALSVLAAISLALWILRRPDGRAGSPSARMTVLTSRGDVDDAVLSPDGRYLAYVSGPEDARSLRVRQIATGSDVEVLPPQEQAARGLTFSPDGNYLFYIGNDPEKPEYSALFQIPSLGGTPQRSAFDVDDAITFAPDGKHACFRRGYSAKNQDALIVLDLESGQERTLATVGEPHRLGGAPSWSPDGKRIAAIQVAGPRRQRVVTFRADDGRRDSVGSEPWLFIVSLAWLPDGSGLVLAAAEGSLVTSSQVWNLSYPEGRRQRITNDWNHYTDVSVSADGTTIAADRQIYLANLWAVETSSRTVRQLTFNSNPENTVAGGGWSPGSLDAEDGSVLFTARREWRRQLFRIDPSGTNEKQITSGPFHCTGARVLRNGGIVFMKYGEDDILHIWRAQADGSNAQQLTKGMGELLHDVSPDGRTILYSYLDGSKPGLWTVSSAGGEATRVAPIWHGAGAFSPDGSRIAYRVVGEVDGRSRRLSVVIPARGGDPIVTLRMPWSDINWAPDGKGITYLDRAGGVSNVFKQRLDGNKPEQVTRLSAGLLLAHEWFRDGSRLLLRLRIDNAENLWTTAADGSHPIQLTNFKTGKIFVMKPMPDGQRVVFIYGTENQDAVLIRNFR